ncbi:MAG TPA: molybdenum cofactor synthesis domain-containing protein [Candidatus Limnocylindrales bacterium]|nr:molybdenum cofactor synthesis domain-containing protein [Candidatus Limnocylindrales bacterium]
MAEIIAVCISAAKGQRKKDVGQSTLIKNQGLEGDAHAGFAHRQVSLLASESIAKMTAKGLTVGPGDFAENLTTTGIDLADLPVGTRLQVGPDAILRVTQIGKECHDRCAIYYEAGDCVMPREGIFAEVLAGGKIKVGDALLQKHAYRFGVITASDKGSCGEREDKSGPAVGEILLPWGDVTDCIIVADDHYALVNTMRSLVDKGVDAIFTTGGTGLGPRDVTPEATLAVVNRLVPGIAETIRRETAAFTAKAMLSRGIAGICGSTLIVNLPGSPKAVSECMAIITPVLEHALETLTGRGGECAR